MADMSKLKEYAKSFFLQRVAGYCLIVVCSLFVIAPLGVLQSRFEEQCVLYSQVVYEVDNSSAAGLSTILFRFRFGPTSVCDYNLAVSALFSLIYSLTMAGGYVFLYVRQKQNKETDLGQPAFLVHGLLEIVILVLMLVSACTVSHGFTSLCADLTRTKIPGYHIDSCSEAQKHKWKGYDASDFYTCLSVATAGCWVQFVLWLLQTALVMWKLWRLNMLPVLPDWMKPGCSG